MSKQGSRTLGAVRDSLPFFLSTCKREDKKGWKQEEKRERERKVNKGPNFDQGAIYRLTIALSGVQKRIRAESVQAALSKWRERERENHSHSIPSSN